MSWTRTVIAGIAFAIMVMLYGLDRHMAEKAVYTAVIEQSLAPGVNKSEVVEIRLRNSHGEVLLARDRGEWRTKTPVDAGADPETVEQLLTNVTGARKRNEIEAKHLAEYGLAAPEISLSLRTEAGKTFDLLLGNSSTYTGQVFAKYPRENKVFTVGEHVRNVLVRTPQEFRRLRLLDVDIGNIDSYKSVKIQTPDRAVVLEGDQGRWRIASPVESLAETDVVRDYLRKIGLLRASGFITEKSDRPTSLAMARQALTSPTIAVTLERTNAPIQRIIVSEVRTASGAVYVGQRMGDEEVLVLRRETQNALSQDENYFRSRGIFSMKPEEVGLFSIEIGRARTDLIRSDKGEWQFVGDPGRRVDQAQVNLRLESLTRARVRNFVDMNPADLGIYGLQPPRYRYTITSLDKTRTEGLEAGRSETGNVTSVFAHRRGDTGVFLMDLSSELVIVPENVADRHFARTDMEQIDHVEVVAEEQKYAFKKEQNDWTVLKPTQTAYTSADTAKLERAIAMLNDLQYEKDYSGAGDKVIAPVGNPPLVVRIYGRGDAQLLDFTVGRRINRTTFVSLGQDRTYEVMNSDLDRVVAVFNSLLQ